MRAGLPSASPASTKNLCVSQWLLYLRDFGVATDRSWSARPDACRVVARARIRHTSRAPFLPRGQPIILKSTLINSYRRLLVISPPGIRVPTPSSSCHRGCLGTATAICHCSGIAIDDVASVVSQSVRTVVLNCMYRIWLRFVKD